MLWQLLFLVTSTEAAHCNASDAIVLIASDGHQHEGNGDGSMLGVEFLQTEIKLSSDSRQNPVAWMPPPSPQILRLVGGSVVLAGFWLMLLVSSTDMLVSAAIFLDLFMTTVLTPLAPTLTPSYQLIALLTSSKNVVTCLIAPFTGSFIDGNEAKSMQLGMLCGMLCALAMAVATR